MESSEIRKYLHDLNNALNAAKINAYLLRRMHGEVLDRETVDGLDGAIYDAERLVADFHRKVHEEHASPPAVPTAQLARQSDAKIHQNDIYLDILA